MSNVSVTLRKIVFNNFGTANFHCQDDNGEAYYAKTSRPAAAGYVQELLVAIRFLTLNSPL